jgi:hypothetical protein
LANRPETQSSGQVIVLEIEMGILEFYNFAAINTDEVVVIGVIDKIWVVGSLTITELDFVDEVSFYEKPKCAVDGGAGGSGASIAKPVKKFIRGEVFV